MPTLANGIKILNLLLRGNNCRVCKSIMRVLYGHLTTGTYWNGSRATTKFQ